MIEKLLSLVKRWDGIPIFFIPLVIFLLRAPLGESLWVDEAITAWIISGDPVIRAIETQGQSPLYFVILKLFSKIFGESELALRSMSILCFLGAVCIFWRLSVGFLGAIGGGVATAALISKDAVTVAAISARPYGLALLLSLATVAAFLKWIKGGKWRWCLLYQFSWALTFYAHYLFLGIGLVLPFAAFASKRVVTWKKIIFSPVIPFALCSFGIPHLAILFDKREALTFASNPELKGALFSAFEPALLTGAIFSMTLAFVFQGKISFSYLLSRTVFFAAVWGLAPLIFFYIFSNGEMFVPRYFLWHVGGIGLLIGAIFSSIRHEKGSFIATSAFTLFMLIHEAQRVFVIEDWRGASVASKELSSKIHPKAPIFVYSGLIEANSLLMERSKEEDEYLTAPVNYYLTGLEAGALQPLPVSLDDGRYFQRFISPSLEKFGSIIAVIASKRLSANDNIDSYGHFESALKERGISMKTEKDLSLVRVVSLIREDKAALSTDQ